MVLWSPGSLATCCPLPHGLVLVVLKFMTFPSFTYFHTKNHFSEEDGNPLESCQWVVGFQWGLQRASSIWEGGPEAGLPGLGIAAHPCFIFCFGVLPVLN